MWKVEFDNWVVYVISDQVPYAENQARHYYNGLLNSGSEGLKVNLVHDGKVVDFGTCSKVYDS